jgi:hypothetical protein
MLERWSLDFSMFSEIIAFLPMSDGGPNSAILRCPCNAAGSDATFAYYFTIRPVRIRIKPWVWARSRDVPPVRAPAIYVDVDVIAPSPAVIL